MKIAFISDTHLGYPRFEEDSFIQGEAAFLDACSKCDVILFAGDLFDVKIPKLETIERAISIFQKVKNSGKKIFAIHGNHERRTKEMTNPVQLVAATGLIEYLHGSQILFEHNGEKLQVFGLGSVPEEYALTALDKYMKNFKPVENAFRVLMIHQTLKEMVPGASNELSMDDIDRFPFDLVVNGHIHAKYIDVPRKLILPGSTVVTQIKPEETESKGYILYDTITKNCEFVPIKCRKFIYEVMEFKEASPDTVQQSVIQKIKELRGDDNLAIISMKIRGTLKEGLSNTDVSFGIHENVFIDNQLDIHTLSAKLERIRNFRSEKLSVREVALKELSEKTKGRVTMFDSNDLFEHLVESTEGTMEYLESKKKVE